METDDELDIFNNNFDMAEENDENIESFSD